MSGIYPAEELAKRSYSENCDVVTAGCLWNLSVIFGVPRYVTVAINA